MTIPVSAVPAVKQYLFNGVTAGLTGDGSNSYGVVYDVPGPSVPNDIVVIGDVDRQVKPLGMTGGGGASSRIEQFTITVQCRSFRGGDDAPAVTDRAWAMAAVVEDVVRADISLGGLVTSGWPTTSTSEGSWDEGHKGRLCLVTIAVQCLNEL